MGTPVLPTLVASAGKPELGPGVLRREQAPWRVPMDGEAGFAWGGGSAGTCTHQDPHWKSEATCLDPEIQ